MLNLKEKNRHPRLLDHSVLQEPFTIATKLYSCVLSCILSLEHSHNNLPMLAYIMQDKRNIKLLNMIQET